MGKNLAIAGLVLTILGLILSFFSAFPFVSIVALALAITGLVLAVVGGKKLSANNLKKGLATAGLVIGIIAIVLSGIGFITCGACQICLATEGDDIIDDINSSLSDDSLVEKIEDALNDATNKNNGNAAVQNTDGDTGNSNQAEESNNNTNADSPVVQTPAENNTVNNEVELDMSGLLG